MEKHKGFTPSGFTLVELAIVLMIIGLLIGGILKGQELITNARITTGAAQLKSYDAAVLTFMDGYGAWPGDITNPSTRLPNCSAAMCNTAGDGNGAIGSAGITNEANAFWLHLGAANLVSGIDMNSAWAPGTMYAASQPVFKIDGNVIIRNMATAAGAVFPDGVRGHTWILVSYLPDGTNSAASLPLNLVARLDTKIDDGKPCFGIVKARGYCTTYNGATTYDVTDTRAEVTYVNRGF